MKGLLKFLRKVKLNKNNMYSIEKLAMMGIVESFLVMIVTIVLLVFPYGRIILKCFTYISVFLAGIGASGVFFENIHYFYSAYKSEEKLEKSGITREDVILQQKQLSETREI